MKKLLPVCLLTLICNYCFSQSIFGGEKEYIYGRMVGSTDTLVGYFWFDNQLSQNGQTVHFKTDLNSNKKKKFQSREYLYFESDSLYLETFGAIPTITGDILIMIPRILNGRIQLFDSKYKWGTLYLFKMERFFLKKDGDKIRIKKKKFKEQMKQYIGDDEILMRKIDNEELTYDDLVEIVATYNNNHP